jgi:DNA-binding LytR/AlgR family response regulator
MQKQSANFFGTPIFIGNRTKLYSNEILFFEGDINYSWIHFKSGKQKKVVACTLLHIEQQTEAETFVRISRKHLVNRMFIEEINKGFVILSDKTVLPIARRRKGVLCTEK